MKPKKPDPINELLRKTMEGLNDSEAPSSATQPPPPDRLNRSSISYHAAERRKVNQILDLLRDSRGKYGGLSDAIRIAIHLCPLDAEKIGEVWESTRTQDGRTKREWDKAD